MNKISDEKIKNIIEAKKEGGLPSREIANRLNVSIDCVTKYWKEYKKNQNEKG